jgi:hypothetical protein
MVCFTLNIRAAQVPLQVAFCALSAAVLARYFGLSWNVGLGLSCLLLPCGLLALQQRQGLRALLAWSGEPDNER